MEFSVCVYTNISNPAYRKGIGTYQQVIYRIQMYVQLCMDSASPFL